MSNKREAPAKAGSTSTLAVRALLACLPASESSALVLPYPRGRSARSGHQRHECHDTGSKSDRKPEETSAQAPVEARGTF